MRRKPLLALVLLVLAVVTVQAQRARARRIRPGPTAAASGCSGSGVTICSTSGTFSDGSSVTLSVANAGSTGPTPVIFDDFEAGTNGNAIHGQAGKVGTWKTQAGSLPVYSTDQHLSGTKAMKVDTSLDGSNGPGLSAVFSSLDVFASWWVMVPSGDVVNGNGSGQAGNWKLTWLDVDTGTNDITVPGTNTMQTSTTDYADHWKMFGNNNPMEADNSSNFDSCTSHYPSCVAQDFNFAQGVWYRMFAYLHGHTVDGSAVTHFWMSSVDGNFGVTSYYNSTHANIYTNVNWVEWIFNGYNRLTTSGTNRLYMDDIYMATGTSGSAQARVEVGDASTYAACKRLAMVTTTSWSASSIAGVFRKGGFANGTAYLYVTTGANAVNATGFAITVS